MGCLCIDQIPLLLVDGICLSVLTLGSPNKISSGMHTSQPNNNILGVNSVLLLTVARIFLPNDGKCLSHYRLDST